MTDIFRWVRTVHCFYTLADRDVKHQKLPMPITSFGLDLLAVR